MINTGRNTTNKRMMNTKTRQEQYREQVLCKLINETHVIHNENINWYNIELPFSKVRVYYNEEHKPTHKEQAKHRLRNTRISGVGTALLV